MTILQPGSPGLYPTDITPQSECYTCGKPLGLKHAVLWHGFGDELWLHASCALQLGVHLICDATKAEMEERGGIVSPSDLMTR